MNYKLLAATVTPTLFGVVVLVVLGVIVYLLILRPRITNKKAKSQTCFTTKTDNDAINDEEAACISDDENTDIDRDEHVPKSKSGKPLPPIQTGYTPQSSGNKGSTVGKGSEEMHISETSLGGEIKTLHIESNDENEETKQKKKNKKYKKEKKRKEKANETEMTENTRSNKVYPDTDHDTDSTK